LTCASVSQWVLLQGPMPAQRAFIMVWDGLRPDYVSQSSDVRPENFGLSGSAPIHGRRYEDLKAFMARPDELAAELLEMSISSMKIWPLDFAAGALDGVEQLSPRALLEVERAGLHQRLDDLLVHAPGVDALAKIE